MSWCMLASSHFQKQNWHIPMSPDSVTWPQWVDITIWIGIFLSMFIWHYSDVLDERGGVLISPASWWFVQPFVQEQIKENNKAPRLRPLWVEFIDDRWIPFHEELMMRKMFQFDDVILARVSTIYHIRGMANENFTFTMIIVYDNDTL